MPTAEVIAEYMSERVAHVTRPANVDALVDVVMAVARLASACGDQIAELDLNPVIVNAERAVAVDSLVIAR